MIGEWGGPGGGERNVQVTPGRLNSVTIHSGGTIDAISFTYIGTDYIEHSEGPWGRPLNTKSTVRVFVGFLSFPSLYICLLRLICSSNCIDADYSRPYGLCDSDLRDVWYSL